MIASESRNNGINENGETQHTSDQQTGNASPSEATTSRTEIVSSSESRLVENGIKTEGN